VKKDDKRTLFVVLIVCIICVIIILFVNRKSNYEKIYPINDYSTYFSVVREINNYIGFIAMNDKISVSNLLDDSVGDDTILEYGTYSPLVELNVDEIGSVKIGNNYLYFLKGKIIENDFESSIIVNDNYMVLVLNDISNNSYSIIPVNGDNYKRIINGIKKISIERNSVNEMIVSDDFSDAQICKLYFSHYMNKLFNNTVDAYDMLSDNMKKRFSSYEEFNKYINDNMSKITSSSKLCKMDEYKENRIYTVIDNNDNSYIFSENGVMNYKVDFYFKNNDD